MTASAPIPAVLGRAENAHRAVLKRILTSDGRTYQEWVATTILARHEPMDSTAFVSRIVDALKIDPADAAAVVDELTGDGLVEPVTGDFGPVTLTDAGRSWHAATRAAVDTVVARLYDGIPDDELAVTGRVLALVVERAEQELRLLEVATSG